MKAEFNGVTVASQGAVGVVTFHRPPLNYFDIGLIEAIADALELIDSDDELRAVVLQSQGKTFCAGAVFTGDEAQGGGTLSDPGELYRRALRLFRTRKPIIAAVQGAAIGGGLGLAMVADFRVAAPEARFAANFVKIGLHAGFGLTHTLPRALGQQAASMLLYSGHRISGKEALRIGLCDQLAPLEQLHEVALGLASSFAENAPLAVEATRATMRRGLADAIADQTTHECAEQIALFATKDFAEGVRAVAERRPGNWARR